jgi:hypothetical protein
MSEQSEPAEIVAGGIPGRLADTLALGVLAVASLRVAVSIATGLVRAFTNLPGAESHVDRVAAIVETFTEFGDGSGALLAGVALAVVWSGIRSGSDPRLDERTSRSLLWCGWLTEIWLLTAVAALVNGVAAIVPDWHVGSLRWLAVLEDGGFQFCYGILGLLGLYATRRLRGDAVLLGSEIVDDKELG